MSRSLLIAVLVAAALAAWIGSGYVLPGEGRGPEAPAPRAEREPFPVEARRLLAEPVTRFLVSQGEALPNRQATLRAELAGAIEEILAPAGTRVEAGDVVARVGLGDLPARLEEAQALVAQNEAAYEAAVQLGERGFAADQTLRERFTALQASRATLARIEREVENARIVAPFGGIVDDVRLDAGAFVGLNGEVADVIDLDPIVVRISVPQQSIGGVALGRPASLTFATGAQAQGEVSFVSARADPQTRAFRVEVTAPNPEGEIPAGVSAEARIPIEETLAHFFSPALLSLSTEGELGVKTVDADGLVRFHAVEIVRAQAQGIYVSGLPEEALVITVGQGFVQEGEAVRVVEARDDPASRAPAASAPADAIPGAEATGALP